jgi:N-acetylglucosaminyldiphosphoundecaprenol N-acetyl-beta-D-mannosaminyltransferase
MSEAPVAVRNPFGTCNLLGMAVARATAAEVLDHMFGDLERGHGGWIVTANLDFLRRHARDGEVRALYREADLVVADGMPLVWAARLQGERLPERVTGASLIWLIAERAARAGRSLYLLGGDPSVNASAIAVFRERWPAVRIAGTSSPMVANPPTAAELAALEADVVAAAPDVLLVGMGSPKQEHVIRALRSALPRCWMIGVGTSFAFVAGTLTRAPGGMQRVGLEWFWRLAHEPRRLARRYLVEDLPFAVELFARALATRRRRGAVVSAPPSDARSRQEPWPK